MLATFVAAHKSRSEEDTAKRKSEEEEAKTGGQGEEGRSQAAVFHQGIQALDLEGISCMA